MTKQEIEKAANESAHSFGSMEPCIAKIKQDVVVRAFVIGATMVNEKQPYTPDDMEEFSYWYHRKVSVIGESELHLFGVRPFEDIISFWKKEKESTE